MFLNNVIHKKIFKHACYVWNLGGKFKCIIAMYARYKNKLMNLKVFGDTLFIFFSVEQKVISWMGGFTTLLISLESPRLAWGSSRLERGAGKGPGI